MSIIKIKTSLAIFVVLISLLLVLGGCAPVAEAALPTPIPEGNIDVPEEVLQARDALLDYVREGANECVPQVGVRWQPSLGVSPQGFAVYQFTADSCLITVSYPLADEGRIYHVALGNPESNFCWQATVNENGRIQTTGVRAELLPEIANAAAAYCKEQGHRYEIQTQADGRECGMCVFDDQSACNAWMFFQGKCP